MKRILALLRSMRFANILLALVAACSGISSLLPQGRELAYYAENYPRAYLFIYRTQIYDIFKSWYFIALMALLSLSMLACTAGMLKKALRGGAKEKEAAFAAPNVSEYGGKGLEELRLHMAKLRCREEERDGAFVFTKNAVGRWGTFMIHLAILLTIVFGAVALYTPEVTDRDCRAGGSIVTDDGTRIDVESFRLTDEGGKTDYASVIRVTLPDGRQSAPTEIKVNYPLSFGGYKIFQWTYGAGGSVSLRRLDDGASDELELDGPCILSADGRNGVEYLGVFKAESADGSSPDYVFYGIRRLVDGRLGGDEELLPGQSVAVGGVEYTFNDPYRTGLRIKRMPFRFANALLEAAFVLMLAGMVVCFYLPPVLVRADERGYAVLGAKGESLRLELARRFGGEEDEA